MVCKCGAARAPTEQNPIFSWAPGAWFTGERQGRVQCESPQGTSPKLSGHAGRQGDDKGTPPSS